MIGSIPQVPLRKLHSYWLAVLLLTIAFANTNAEEMTPSPAYESALLNIDLKDIDAADIVSGNLDSQFKPFKPTELERAGKVFWLKFTSRMRVWI